MFTLARKFPNSSNNEINLDFNFMENITIRPPNFKRFIAIGDGENFLELWKHAIIKPEIIVGYNEAKIMPVKIREIEKETFLANLQLNIEYLQKWEKLENELKKYKIETEKLIKNKVISNNEKESAKTKLEWSNKELENIEEIIFGIRENLTKIPNEKLKENYDRSKLISIKNLLENNNIAAINVNNLEQPLNSERIIHMENSEEEQFYDSKDYFVNSDSPETDEKEKEGTGKDVRFSIPLICSST
uniref:Uncharacterized protein n=1 Tax=Meloidogyne floridensis TaxID=298350 RepID=A0A915NMX3_9BILA